MEDEERVSKVRKTANEDEYDINKKKNLAK